MRPHLQYRRQAHTGWSRIEMLLAIYDATVASLDAGIQALQGQDQAAYSAQHLRATKLILLLLDGVDVNSGPVAERIRDLCIFCVEQIANAEIEKWQQARNVIDTLREGFRGIQDEANQLEVEGAIPKLCFEDAQTLLHV